METPSPSSFTASLQPQLMTDRFGPGLELSGRFAAATPRPPVGKGRGSWETQEQEVICNGGSIRLGCRQEINFSKTDCPSEYRIVSFMHPENFI